MFLNFSIWLCKVEQKNGVPICFSFSQQEFSKMALNESEFLFHKNRYDIISIAKEKNRVHITCQKDEKESDILEKISEHIAHQKKSGKPIFSFFTHFLPEENKTQLPFKHITSFEKSVADCFCVITQYIDYISPPPKLQSLF
ncbi:MAG: hypothetical protein JST67_01175 [Bacteroidetes bacterium]|nr:hypothetical protein [Bacteroidota bacterium]